MSADATPSFAGFASAVGTTFRVRAPDAVDVILVEATPEDAPAEWERFSLVFATEAAALLQGTYEVDHAELGTFALFLVPIAADRCEAIFNRPAFDDQSSVQQEIR